MPNLELPGHGEGEALVRDVVPLVGKVESPDVNHQFTLHVLHVVMQRRDEMPDTRETCLTYIKGCPLIVHRPMFRIRIQSVQWILSQKSKNYTQIKTQLKFHVLKYLLDVLFWGLKASSVAWTSSMETKTLDPDSNPNWLRIRIQPKMLDPDQDQMNTDPRHCHHQRCGNGTGTGTVTFWLVEPEP